MKLFRIAMIAAAVAAVVAFAGIGVPEIASSGRAAEAPRSITVTGSGSVSAVPDHSTFTFGVSTQGPTAAEAMAADSARMQKLIAALRDAGIDAASLQTSSVSLSPQMADDGRTVVGYQASNSVTATISRIDRAGSVVDTAVGAGANEVEGPDLAVADQSALYASALKAAVADARSKADALAAVSGLHVAAVRSVEEQTDVPSPVRYDALKSASAPVPIEAGSQQLTAAVTVTFDATA